MRILVRLWVWVRSWFSYSRMDDKISTLHLRINQLVREKQDIERRLASYLREADKWREEIQRAKQLNETMNLSLNTALIEIENMREITIPGLVAANRTLISRWESEVQVHAMRTAAMKVGSELDE